MDKELAEQCFKSLNWRPQPRIHRFGAQQALDDIAVLEAIDELHQPTLKKIWYQGKGVLEEGILGAILGFAASYSATEKVGASLLFGGINACLYMAFQLHMDVGADGTKRLLYDGWCQHQDRKPNDDMYEDEDFQIALKRQEVGLFTSIYSGSSDRSKYIEFSVHENIKKSIVKNMLYIPYFLIDHMFSLMVMCSIAGAGIELSKRWLAGQEYESQIHRRLDAEN